MLAAFTKFLDPVSYSKNVVKSAGYVGKAVIKGLNPTLTKYVEQNASTVKDLWDSLKTKTANPAEQINSFFNDNEYGQTGKQFASNLLEDLKTGKFYNTERAEKNTKESINELFGFDFTSDDPFGLDDDGGKDDSSNSQAVTKNTVMGVGVSLATANRQTVSTSMSRLMHMSRVNTKAMMTQNAHIMNSINRSVNAVNGTMLMIYQNMSKPLSDHMTNSSKFYTAATEQLSLQTGYIKEIRDMLSTRYNPKKKSWGDNETAWDKIFSDKLPSLKEIVKNSKENIQNSSLGMMASLIDPAMLKAAFKGSDFYSNPISALIALGARTAFRRTAFSKGLDRSLEAFPGLFAAGMKRANDWSKKQNSLQGMLVNILTEGIVPGTRNKFDLSKYEKGRTDWTGKNDKALREVIPTQLSLILSALTGNDPKVFNYETGRWETGRGLMAKFEKARRENITSVSNDFRYNLSERLSDKFGISQRSNAMTSILSDYDNLVQIIATDSKTDPTNKNALRRYLKSKGYMGPARDKKNYAVHEENFDLIFDAIEEKGYADYRARFVSSAWGARSKNSEFMNRLMMDDKQGFGLIRNGSGITNSSSTMGNINKFNSNMGIFARDDKGHNLFFYLQNFYSDIKKISHFIETGTIGHQSPTNIRNSNRIGLNAFDVPIAVEKAKADKKSNDIALHGFIRSSKYYDIHSLRGKSFGNDISGGNGVFGSVRGLMSSADIDEVPDIGPRPEENFIGGVLWDIRNFLNTNGKHDGRKTVFDTINEGFSRLIFGENPDKKDITKGIVGSINEIPKSFKEAMTDIKVSLFNWLKDSELSKQVRQFASDRWKNFKKSDTFNEFMGDISSAARFTKSSFTDTYKAIKSSPFAATIKDGLVNATGNNAVGGHVVKSGVASVSEGEIILPAYLNPFYKKFIPDSTRDAIERKNSAGWLKTSMSDDYDFYGNFRKGGKGRYKNKKKSKTGRAIDGTIRTAKGIANLAKGALTEEASNIKEDIEDAVNQNSKAKKAIDELGKAAKAFKSTGQKMYKWVDEALGKDDAYKKLKEKAGKFKGMAKGHKGSMAAGGLIGGSIGAILTGGSSFGFLGGAAIGSMVSLTTKSKEFSEKMFGKYDKATDSYAGGMLGKDLSNFIKKKFPKMAKSGIVGATVNGLIGGPAGILGGFVIGAGLNYLSGSFDVQDAILGAKGVDGVRRGGLVGMVKLRVIDPISNYVQKGLGNITSYLMKWVLDPLKKAANAGADWTKGFFTKIGRALYDLANKRVFPRLVDHLDTLFKPLTGVGGLLGRAGGFLASKLGTVPGRMVNTASDMLNRHNVAMGYSTLAPEERVKLGESYLRQGGLRGIKKFFGGDPNAPLLPQDGIFGKLGRMSRLRVQNEEYNRFAASKDVSSKDLQDILDASQSNGEYRVSQTARKQKLHDTLAASMVNGGLNNKKDLKNLRGILNSRYFKNGDKKSQTIAVDNWLRDQVKKGTISRENLEKARSTVFDTINDMATARDAHENSEEKKKEIEAKWGGRFKFSDLKGANAKRILTADIRHKKDTQEYEEKYDDSEKAKKKRYKKTLDELADNNPVENEKLEYFKNISKNVEIITGKMNNGKKVDETTSDSDAKNIVDSVMKGESTSGEDSSENGNEIKTMNETEKVVKGGFHKAGEETTEEITETTSTGVIKYTKSANGDIKPDTRDADTKENYEQNKKEQKAKISFFERMLGTKKDGGGFLDKLQGFFGIGSKDKKEKKKSVFETLMDWGGKILGVFGGLFGTIKGFFTDALGSLSTIAGFGTSIAAIGALAVTLKGFFETKGNVFDKIHGANESFNKAEATILGDKRVTYDKKDVNGNKEFQDPRLLSRVASHTFWSGMVAGGTSKLVPGLLGKGINAASKAGFKAMEIGVETGAEAGVKVLPKAATVLSNVGSKIANSKVGAVVARSAESGFLSKIFGAVKGIISKVAVLLGKNGAQAAEAASGVAEQASGAIAQAGRTHGGASILSKIAGPLRIAQILLAVENGFEDAQANLGILDPPTIAQRAVSAIVAGISDLMFGLIPTSTLLNIGIFIGNALGLKLDGLNEQRAAAKAEMDEWNANNPDQQYNNVREYLKNRYGLYTTQDKIARFAKGVGGKVWGGIKTAGKGIFTAGKELIKFKQAEGKMGIKALQTGFTLFRNQNRLAMDTFKLVGGKAIKGIKDAKKAITKKATNYLKDKAISLSKDKNFMMTATFGKNLSDAFKSQDPIKNIIGAFKELIGKPADMDIKGSFSRIAASITEKNLKKDSNLESAVSEIDKNTGMAKPNTLFGLMGNAIEKLLKAVTAPVVLFFKAIHSFGDKIKGVAQKILPDWIQDKLGILDKSKVQTNSSPIEKAINAVPLNFRNDKISMVSNFKDDESKAKIYAALHKDEGSGSHISQIYNSIASRKFGTSDVAREGCGPAVATSVLRRFGKNVSLKDSVDYAIKRGYAAGASGVGTNAGFFGDILGRNGINTRYTESQSNIKDSIKSGLPTILLGRNGGNRSKANSPFGPTNHYVVAQGMDRKGNVIVDDPELKGTALYNKSILRDVKMGVTAGGDSGIPLAQTQSAFQSSMKKANLANNNLAKERVQSQVNQNQQTSSALLNDDYVGKYVKKFESGDKGPDMISKGTGDYGGVSYGTYQLASFAKDGGTAKKGLLTNFWDKYYANKYPGLTVANTPAFQDAWMKEVNANRDQFITNEHTFIADNFYTPSVNKLKTLGFDVDNYDRGVQEAVWSSAVQYGPGKLLTKMFTDSGVNTSMTPSEFIDKLYGYKINNVGSNFKSSSQSVRDGITKRYNSERDIVKGLAGQKPINPYSVGIPGVSIPSSNVPAGYANNNAQSTGTMSTGDNTDNSLTGVINSVFGGWKSAISQNLSGTTKSVFDTIFGLNNNTSSSTTTGTTTSTGTTTVTSTGTGNTGSGSYSKIDIPVATIPNFGFTSLSQFKNLLYSTVGYLEKANGSNLGDFTDEGKVVNAGDKNYTIYWEWYRQLGKGNMQGSPYCACYVSTMLSAAFGVDKARNLLCGDLYTYCPDGYSRFKSQNRIFDTPAPFDIVFFWNNKMGRWSHTGIVVAVDSNGYTTIEANTSSGNNTVVRNGGATCEKHYTFGASKAAFGRPDYAGNGISGASGSGSGIKDLKKYIQRGGKSGTIINSTTKQSMFSRINSMAKNSVGNNSNIFPTYDFTNTSGGNSGIKPSSVFDSISNTAPNVTSSKFRGGNSSVPIYDFTKKYKAGESGLDSVITDDTGVRYTSSGAKYGDSSGFYDSETSDMMGKIAQLLATIAQNTSNNTLLAPILKVLQETMAVMATMNSSNTAADSETKDKINIQLYNMMNKLDAISKAV